MSVCAPTCIHVHAQYMPVYIYIYMSKIQMASTGSKANLANLHRAPLLHLPLFFLQCDPIKHYFDDFLGGALM